MQPKFHRKELERDLHDYLLGSGKDDSQCNWCRKLTPYLRSAGETEHILGKEETFSASRYFGEVRVERFFHLATLGAVPFRNLSLFTPVLKTLTDRRYGFPPSSLAQMAIMDGGVCVGTATQTQAIGLENHLKRYRFSDDTERIG